MTKRKLIQVQLDKIMFYPPSKGYAILLKDIEEKRQLPIIVGVYEAQAIALGLEQVKMPRPLTHDLFTNFIREQELSIKKVVINDLIDGTFYANIFMEKNDSTKIIKIDSRPSDAIALAVRVGGELFVTEKVMNSAAQVIKKQEKQTVKKIKDDANLDQIFDLQMQLQKAIDDENYEQAASIRDKINNLEKDKNKN